MNAAETLTSSLQATIDHLKKTNAEIAAAKVTMGTLQATIEDLSLQLANAGVPQNVLDLAAQAQALAQQADEQLPDLPPAATPA